jgi:protein-arginine kinase activator protein McsA
MICTECFIRTAEHFITVENNGFFETEKICTECLNARHKAEAFKQFTADEESFKMQSEQIKRAQEQSNQNANKAHIYPKIAPFADGSLPKVGISISCPNCGFLESDFETSGYLGCTVCYKTFESLNAVIDTQQGKGVLNKGNRI